MTSPTPTPSTTPDPDRPSQADKAALFDAVTTEHAAIYGYGIVSAHSSPDENELVSQALAQHRERREAAIKMLTGHSAKAPLPAVGYRLPFPVANAVDAAKLAVRMENDCAVAWRAALEQASSQPDREFGVSALTESAVLAARWNQVLGRWPVTVAFPGGSE
ncbi:ferritin-like domain-containing protein [Candidatus Mycolicibacterium alkanivorans]|uniref:Ferritin-like domain-containing protein n=1 Tax=Candidatus Mycolicibacterium alkanivorans TaxID=2954114 RepID=A0ABS9YYU1_9MYCO|nr:ferritin-like domain-containing protein [Candidatus Mycolicibacterium alkanivorans]MCI4676380.1 ferritin-like domain-containing protein [Candidatus Mycolicibacterium alkanivorans]